MRSYFFLISTLTFLILSIPIGISALGLSVSPPTISVKTVAGEEGVARFTVTNPSNEVAIYEAYPEEFEESISLIPSRFTLESGEKREVLLRARRREMGIIRTAIAIEAQPLGLPSLGIGGGVRLPFSLEVRGEMSQLASVVFSDTAPWIAFILVVLSLLFFWRREAFRAGKKLLGV